MDHTRGDVTRRRSTSHTRHVCTAEFVVCDVKRGIACDITFELAYILRAAQAAGRSPEAG